MIQTISLIALDLDGTLFNRDRQITTYTREQIKAATDAGIAVVLSTGRPYVGLPLEEAAELGIHYAITTNGAAVYEIPSRHCLYEECLDNALSYRLIQEILQYHVHLDAFVDGNAITQASSLEVVKYAPMPESTRNYILTTRERVTDLYSYLKEHHLSLQKATMNFEMESDGNLVDREEVKKLLLSHPEIQVVSGGYHNLEFTKKGVTKAKGLRYLCEYLNIPLASTMVCGDSDNDRDIMQTAGLSIAMANAEDDIKAIADDITKSNEKDGVGCAIHKYVTSHFTNNN